MAEPYAEVIGDPIAHSRSPAIHDHWLRELGLSGRYQATQVAAAGLADYLSTRRQDPDWRGCSVTAPHKEAVLPHLDRLSGAAEQIGAVNCIVPEGTILTGHNTDVAGILAALAGIDIIDRRAILIGAGGAARAAVYALHQADAGEIVILARDPARAEPLVALAPGRAHAASLTDAAPFRDAALLINATPLGMPHAPPFPPTIFAHFPQLAPGAAALDMVYDPLDTPFLAAARAAGLRPIDGLAMLIGQARRAFRLLFGADPPADEAALRRLLAP